MGFCQGETAEKNILYIESQISKSVLDNDTAKYSSFLTDDFEFSVPEGNNISKKQFLLDMKKFWHPTVINRSEQKVRINKYVAIVTGLAESKWNESGIEFIARERYTETYLFDKGRWLLMAGQSCEETINDKSIYENQVKTTISSLWKAWETGNQALAEPIYNKDFIDIDFKGIRRNKAEVLNFLKPLPNTETAQILLSDWYFIVKNTTVVANYIVEDKRTRDGRTITTKFRATDTFIKRYGHWQIISGQQILINEKQ